MTDTKLSRILEELSTVRHAIASIESQALPLKQREEELRDDLVAELRANGMKSINSELTGETYARAERFSFKVADEKKALAFAKKNDALRVDATKIARILRTPSAPLPETVGFETNVTEYLSIKTNNTN